MRPQQACVAVKLQLARFEVFGAAGAEALTAVAEHARAAGLLVIADGKRGDIDVSAQAYAQALFGGMDTPFGSVRGLGADLVTVNPLMGRDAIQPFVTAARAAGGGHARTGTHIEPGRRRLRGSRAGRAEMRSGSGLGRSCTSWARRASARRA